MSHTGMMYNRAAMIVLLIIIIIIFEFRIFPATQYYAA